MSRLITAIGLVVGLSTGCATSVGPEPEPAAEAATVRTESGRDADASIWARATRAEQGASEEEVAVVRWSPATRLASWQRGTVRGETAIERLDPAGAERLVTKLAEIEVPPEETAYTTCGRYFGCAYIELWGATCNVCSFVTTSCDTGMTMNCASTGEIDQ